ncbi:DinB family protein [Calothrix sp. PCC 6303]|uniref:DinB family protein n=1 Tax=Calothrix sp. PCC 6303 TaxID=1170562 RepID=UPI0002A026B5|nr:DinB family protein [Calothrix sp. PCC 6303]AFZ01034.1 DinB family protein [Calothrix sp. PCC 6303]
MTLLKQIQLMAQYNQWMNENIYTSSMKLSNEKLSENKKAFFKSISGTLNHILVADIIWLKIFSQHPANYTELEPITKIKQPTSLDQILHSDFDKLFQERRDLDYLIIKWCHEISEVDLSHHLEYKNMKEIPAIREFGSLIFHFFNHQTHHRGQVSTLLFQEGIDVGNTGLQTQIPDYIGT